MPMQATTSETQVHAFGRRLGATLDAKVKAKIWADEFVDFMALLPHTRAQPPAKEQQAGDEQRKVITFAQWLNAFCTYASVKGERNTSEAHELFTYLQNIIELHQSFPNTPAWRLYDEEFRRQRAVAPTAHPWAVINWHHYNRAVMTNLASQLRPLNKQRNQGAQAPIQFCFAYNNQGTCARNPCLWAHVCKTCRGRHPRIFCRKNNPNMAGQQPFRSKGDAVSPSTQGKHVGSATQRRSTTISAASNTN
jgi:hypothetical protein